MSNLPQILKALAVTAELTGTQFSDIALATMAKELGAYPLEAVLQALGRCRRELSGRLTLAAVLERLDGADGRPGAEEAWGMIVAALGDERESVVWTEEMAGASAFAAELLRAGDKVGARMAFREAYERLVGRARESGAAPVWRLSAGTDKAGQTRAVMRAVEQGRLPPERAGLLLPDDSAEERHQLLVAQSQRRLLADLSAPAVAPLSEEDRRRGRALTQRVMALLAKTG